MGQVATSPSAHVYVSGGQFCNSGFAELNLQKPSRTILRPKRQKRHKVASSSSDLSDLVFENRFGQMTCLFPSRSVALHGLPFVSYRCCNTCPVVLRHKRPKRHKGIASAFWRICRFCRNLTRPRSRRSTRSTRVAGLHQSAHKLWADWQRPCSARVRPQSVDGPANAPSLVCRLQFVRPPTALLAITLLFPPVCPQLVGTPVNATKTIGAFCPHCFAAFGFLHRWSVWPRAFSGVSNTLDTLAILPGHNLRQEVR